MVLSVAYLLWLEGISKDWLLSYVEPYPLMASLATTVAVIGGFVALLLVQTPMRWHGPILCITLTLTITDLSGITPKQLGIFPAVPVLAFALGTASLFTGNRQAADRNERFYAAAAVASGAISLCAGGAQSKKLLWALSLILVVAAVSGLAVWLAKWGGTSLVQPRGRAVLARSCAALIVAGFGILVGVTFGPSLSLGISDVAMLGLGLEWQHRTNLSRSGFLESFALLAILAVGVLLLKRWLRLRPDIMGHSFLVPLICIGGPLVAVLLSMQKEDKYGLTSVQESSSLEAFGRTLATEYGLLTALVVGLLLWTAVVTGVLKLLHVRPDTDGEAQGARIALCAGSISTLYGLLLSSRLGPPFMTSDSIIGTTTLAVVVASAGFRSSSVGTSHGQVFCGKMAAALRRKVSLVLLTGSLAGIALLLSLGLLYYRRNLEQMIEPYMDGRTAPGFSSGYTPLSEISTTMQDAIIACEDPRFFDHRGFEWRSLHSALRLNLREARIILGHSTITQQLAKNLFLTKERTLSRKIREAAITFALERLLSKERILELYLNVIEYGSDQRGILAAAEYYFDKSPKELSLAESALLAGLVSRTSHSSSLHELAVRQRRALNLIRWKWRDRYSEADTERASAIPLYRLLRATIRETGSKENEPNQQAQASTQSTASPVRFWRNIGLLISLGIFLGCVATVTFGVQALRVTNRPNGAMPPSIRMKVLLSAAMCSLFAMFGLHWYQSNRERALTTVLYPYRHSPNYDRRPAGSNITCVVLHATRQRTLEAAINSFQDPNTKASAHFIVGKDGRIFQTVPVERRAWHAGNSQLESEADVDNFSVGIALVHQNDARDAYSDLQYEAVARIIHQLRQSHDIPDRRIVSHAQIALPPAGVSDPEGFDFDKLRKLLHSFSGA